MNIKFQTKSILMVAGDMSAIHPSSWRNGLASETRLSTPFKKILAMALPSVAKREPESSELSSSDLYNIIDLYEDDLPASAALDTELHCWDVKWRGKIEEAKCNNSPSKAMRETDTDFYLPAAANSMHFACHQDIPVDLDRIIDEFARKYQRIMHLRDLCFIDEAN